MSYVSIHQHSVFSLLDGYAKIPDMVKIAKEYEWSGVCLTDHNHLLGIPELISECEKADIKPMLGMEGYFTPKIDIMMLPVDKRHELAIKNAIESGDYIEEQIAIMKKKELQEIYTKYLDMHDNHIIFIAKDQQGWNNLVKLQSEAARLCTFNGRYHADYDLIEKYHEGVICTSACVASFPSRYICKGKLDQAFDYVDKMVQIFGDDFYLEIQPWNHFLQRTTNLIYQSIAKDKNIKVIATNDSHWVRKEDAEEHDVLLCVGTGSKLNTLGRMSYDPVFWMRSEEEMIEAFQEQANDMINTDHTLAEDNGSLDEYIQFYSEALSRTQEIADKVEPHIKLGADHALFPSVKISEDTTPEQVLKDKAFAGLGSYLDKHPECDKWQYMMQLTDELDVINKKGFAPYFLTVEEYTSWCRDNEIPVGPGRGSAAGSLVLFSIGVTTNIDPIKDKLMFSRFLTADRKSPPDIDLDFSWLRRDEVVHHLEDYYGTDHVAHIGTVIAMKVKTAIKDVCRVLSIDFKESLQISKEIDALSDNPNLTFKEIDSWVETDPMKYDTFHKLEEKYAKVFYYARKFEGIPRQIGVHASGILVTPMPVNEATPLRYIDGTAVTLYSGPEIEAENMIKFDVLGLKQLDVITHTLTNIKLTTDEKISLQDLYDKVDRNDSNIYKLIREKKTEGIFQIESNMMKGIIDKLQPTCFNDISALVSLGRPGPMSLDADTKYANGKNYGELADIPLHGTEHIFGDTYNIPVFQEQLMQVSKDVAGFNDMQADSITRKILGKKIAALMPMLRRCHIYGKKNEKGPEGWETNDELPWYDPKGKYGEEISGALVKGYTKEEIEHYFHEIEAFSSYAFNRSHSASYAYIGILGAWLKYYYPTEFFAANLSIFSGDEERRKKYAQVAKQQFGIELKCPDIRYSGADFTPHDKEILYGLSGLKGVGPAKIPDILKAREQGPFTSLEDVMTRVPKSSFSKTVGEALIKAGAFDWEDPNRYIMLNKFYDLRKDKPGKVSRYNLEKYNDQIMIAFEKEILGVPITKLPWWDTLNDGATVKNVIFKIKGKKEHVQKNGKLMLFCTGIYEGVEIECIIFASIYAKAAGILQNKEVRLSGKKDGTKLIVSDVKPVM